MTNRSCYEFNLKKKKKNPIACFPPCLHVSVHVCLRKSLQTKESKTISVRSSDKKKKGKRSPVWRNVITVIFFSFSITQFSSNSPNCCLTFLSANCFCSSRFSTRGIESETSSVTIRNKTLTYSIYYSLFYSL